ncbi:zincin-like metallopeptidase domain-containing protein [Nitrosomonas sp. Is35]|uniref:zincin-like metallopeptidase domain-containing protein n=1 Tax=unclassified Nitrosomonas TaxID=2609265 RepID=UPI00294AE34D|nr:MULTISPECIES: zincin-like metallopeptidase domain-containing protein [unclassified Nitrosomonas]MDV6342499.1 zincin-like metallopeptidase domain-containing protein [Nitrosomonas sp. Is24]MDV6348404.1 zincin-like metallopeptidase domain-containing protein [Nitrosomonas sp. Is35]
MKEAKKAFHEQVAENLIEQLKKGAAPWQKPWKPGDLLAALPINPTTGKRYRGINSLNLMSRAYTDPRWLTYKQAISLGAQVRKGEKSTLVQYWKFTEEHIKKDDNGNPVLNSEGNLIKEQVRLERPRVFYASVFNAEQMDNLPELDIKAPDWDPLERAEHILQASNAVIRHGEADRAFYRPSTDSIHLPHKHQFPTPDRYYATALHELGHWTGHELRLNRDLSHPFGSEGYGREELRAEIASMLLSGELGIGHDPGQHVAYVSSWIKALQEDPTEIFRAAADAEKIQDFVLALSQQHEIAQKVYAQEAIKMDQIKQNTAAYLLNLSHDLATISSHNIKRFNDLTQDMSKKDQDAIILVADALKFTRGGGIDNLEFEEVAEDKLGFRIPADWNGQLQIQGNTIQTNENGIESIVSADLINMEPQFWGVTMQRDDQTFQWVKDCESKQEAQDLTDLLALIDAAAEQNEHEKAVKLANIHENRIRNDPISTEVSILGTKAEQNDDNARQYLIVPYRDKDLAKAAGARWDKKARSWYVGPEADIQTLQRWLPENVSSQQELATDPHVEFADLLRAQGCLVDGNHPVMDGSKHRIKVEGDKSVEKSGFYVAHLDGHPAGYFKNNRTGIEIRWKARGYSLTDEQKAELFAQAAIKQQNRKAEQHAQQIKVADAIQQLLTIAPAADSEHPYLKDKHARPGDLRIVPQNADDLPNDSIIKIGQNWQEVKVLREENPNSIVLSAGDLLLAAQDVHGQIWGVQTIQPSGAKLFAAGSRKENNFHVVGGESQGLTALDAAPAIVIAEGYATADTLSQALDYPVIAAFDSGNLPKVSKDLHEKYPHKPIIIAGDDDHHLESTLSKNPGKEKALEAAVLVNGAAVFPVFAPGEQDSKKLNDFNDLANKSALGIEAVKRQVGSVFEKVSQQAKQDSLLKLQVPIEPKQQEIKQKRALAR